MSNSVIQETRPYLGILLGVGLLLMATSPLAEDGKCDEFRRCSLIEDPAARRAGASQALVRKCLF
jgi:hypothetical protein